MRWMAARGEGVAEKQSTFPPASLRKGTGMPMDPKVSCGRVWASVPAAATQQARVDTVCLPSTHPSCCAHHPLAARRLRWLPCAVAPSPAIPLVLEAGWDSWELRCAGTRGPWTTAGPRLLAGWRGRSNPCPVSGRDGWEGRPDAPLTAYGCLGGCWSPSVASMSRKILSGEPGLATKAATDGRRPFITGFPSRYVGVARGLVRVAAHRTVRQGCEVPRSRYPPTPLIAVGVPAFLVPR